MTEEGNVTLAQTIRERFCAITDWYTSGYTWEEIATILEQITGETVIPASTERLFFREMERQQSTELIDLWQWTRKRYLTIRYLYDQGLNWTAIPKVLSMPEALQIQFPSHNALVGALIGQFDSIDKARARTPAPVAVSSSPKNPQGINAAQEPNKPQNEPRMSHKYPSDVHLKDDGRQIKLSKVVRDRFNEITLWRADGETWSEIEARIKKTGLSPGIDSVRTQYRAECARLSSPERELALKWANNNYHAIKQLVDEDLDWPAILILIPPETQPNAATTPLNSFIDQFNVIDRAREIATHP